MEHGTKRLLFVCTGNYYRSRFAEAYFRHRATPLGLDWEVASAGLRLSGSNVGPLSIYTSEMCETMGIAIDVTRGPRLLQTGDLERATLTIAVKESEHRHLVRQRFPEWEDRIEFWEVHDIDVAPPEQSLPHLCREVDQLLKRLQRVDNSVPG